MSATAKDVMAMIELIADTPSRTTKEEILARLASTDLGRWALKWTYNSFATFGLTPFRQEGIHDEPFDMEKIDALLESLAQRKLTGDAARDAVHKALNRLDSAGAELLFRILSKDLKCGIAATTVNAVVPGLIPVFAVMRAQSYATKKVKAWPVQVEPKMDGVRITFLAKDGMGGFFTRSGNRLEAYDHLVPVMIKTAEEALASPTITAELRAVLEADGKLNFMVDCEGIAGNRYETIGTSKRGEKGEGLVLHGFDIMSYADFDADGSVGHPYVTRRKLLTEFRDFAHELGFAEQFVITPSYLANNDAEVQVFYGRFLDRGLEGAMVKNPLGLYDKGKSYGWMKLKPEDTEDLPIVGFFNGEPNTKYAELMGGVIVRRPHDGGFVDVRIGGGWSDEQRAKLAELWEHDAKLLSIDPRVGFKPGHSIGLHDSTVGFKLLGRLIEVKFQQVSIYGSLEHPRFVKFRDDKAGEKTKFFAAA